MNDKKNEFTGLEIAVIGMSCRVPGANNLDDFWKVLSQGENTISFFSDEELKESGINENYLRHTNYIKAKGILGNAEYFDPAFFGYTPADARVMDPQIRMLHECTWEALEDSGYNSFEFPGLIGLFTGATSNVEWLSRAYLCNDIDVDDYTKSLLCNKDFASTLISYRLNLRGPSVSVSAACSTSLVAVHMACQSLLSGECNIAVAGGVSIIVPEKVGYHYNVNMMHSPDGYCRAFDENAGGTLFSNGAGMIALKPLEDAIKDHDNIYAIIKGSAINNDGSRKVGYTAPSASGEATAIKQALSASQVNPETISYVEAHGTGTIIGDPIEVEALKKAYNTSKCGYCGIGSLKSNMGHMDAASGIAGCIKTILSMRYKLMPPSINFTKANSKIEFENSPFYVNTTLKRWEDDFNPIRAGVSSFGVGGTNAHIILEEALMGKELNQGRKYKIVVVSAQSNNALENASHNLADYIEKHNEINLDDAVYTLCVGRRRYNYRKMFVCSSKSEMVNALKMDCDSSAKTHYECELKKNIVFMFPGQGAQYIKMGLGLYKNELVFKRTLDKCFSILETYIGFNLKDILYNGTDDIMNNKILEETKITQPVIFSFEYALAQLMMSWGIYPQAMIGHSLGEYVAACISGVFSLEDALKIVALRGAMMQGLPKGKMVSIEISEDNLRKYLNSKLDLVAVNSGSKCVISGKEEDIVAVVLVLENDGYKTISLKTSHAYHSYMMEPILEEFKGIMRSIKLNSPSIPYISCVSGKWITSDEAMDVEYWAKHLRKTVQFNKGLDTLLTNQSAVFIEVGPGRTLTAFANQHANKKDIHKAVNLVRSTKENIEDECFIMQEIGKMWMYSVDVDWKKFYSTEVRYRISLPTYPFERKKYSLPMVLNRQLELITDCTVNSISQDENNHEGPITEDEDTSNLTKRMIQLWKEYFGIDEISINDNFYDLGGDSLRAMSLIGKVNKTFNTKITISSFLMKPTIKDLVMSLSEVNTEEFKLIRKIEDRYYYPLSPSQRRIYILSQLGNLGTSYNIPFALKIYGKLDKEKVESAFQKLIARHEALRTEFKIMDDQPVQIIKEHAEYEIEYYRSKLEEVNNIVNKFIRCFDIKKAPLIRVGLIDIDDSQCIFLFDIHHIVGDSISISILLSDFVKLYAGKKLAPNKYEYKDYAVWKTSDINLQRLESQRMFWINELVNSKPAINLQYDYSKKDEVTFIGDCLRFELPEHITKQLRAISKTYSATMFIVIFTMYNIVLSKLSGDEDLTIGVITSGRVHPDIENIVGVFINMLALRNYPQKNKSFGEFITDVRDRTLQAFDNQEYEFDSLVEELNIKRDGSNNPLFNAVFDWQNVEYGTMVIEGYKTENYEFKHKVAQFDIHFTGSEVSDKICFEIEYNTDLFKLETIERMRDYFKEIIEIILLNNNITLGDIHLKYSLQEAKSSVNLESFEFGY
ncbi:condensation domain-containing protein [Clostridium tagluense]|uniref:type I polyketide synthase n=1 Tax=Clostridium tagluense TaxID=360422 RepID=UPI001CF55086|nr:type I polyketide synthase [Clostridium tagluense]MCB2311581.1 condensation domain-containing protein [Clostridium tagluense]MCB2316305.1 condensation domain-containing protein [Clostridium tagluense]MCB2321160.1 condensation domain-containing protein [Clostridium tagluense]MCB2326174.1 condensation domain-containing protein [Clostridium tagluense]MCB2330897.1 condensation domain-containing protein [Clostridium tagluense]